MRNYRLKYERERLIEKIQIALAHRAPRWLKKWIYAEVTNSYWADAGVEMGEVRATDAFQEFFFSA